jgi:stage V sporulation protein SpoVS
VCVRDKSLSAKAKGIHTYLLSLPDDWEIYLSELKEHFTDGKASISAGIKELINANYIKRNKIKNELGQFDGYDYTVYENPYSENPSSGNPSSGNRALPSTNRNQGTNQTKAIPAGAVAENNKKEGSITSGAVGTKESVKHKIVVPAEKMINVEEELERFENTPEYIPDDNFKSATIYSQIHEQNRIERENWLKKQASNE